MIVNRRPVIPFLLVIILCCLYPTPAYADTTHCGNVSANEVWAEAGNVHVVTCDVIVPNGVTLTIYEGAIVKFDLGTRMVIDGSLQVLGSVEDPVYITSIRDDAVGGDTNGDGGTTTPDWQNWGGIEFRDSSDDSKSLINHAVIRYGGYDYDGNITLASASPSISNTTLSDGYMAIRADLRSLPRLEDNTYEDNFYNGLGYDGGTISVNTTWSVMDTSYYIIDDVFVGTGATLTIRPGVIVKFELGRRLVVDGALRISEVDEPVPTRKIFLPLINRAGVPSSIVTRGAIKSVHTIYRNARSSASLVYFTSIRDDSVGGDTNGDGGASVPDWLNWKGIEFRDSSDDTRSLIDNAVVRYGGHGYKGNIDLTNASPTIRNTTLSDGYMAIRADLGSLPRLENNTYQDNSYNGLCYDGGTIDVDTTWSITDTSYYLINDVYVGTGITLTVEPEVVVKFELGRRLYVDGALRVLGSSPGPIYFTSIWDDSVGGDTNGDGGATVPDWQNWRGIEFRDSSDDTKSLIDNAVVRYGGYGYSGNISLTSASPTIQNTILSDGYMAVRADLRSLPTLENNTYEDNLFNGLGYDGGTVDIDTTWSITDTSYYVIDNIIVGSGITLTIEPGTIVKFQIGMKLFVDGALRVLGSSLDPVYFTSIRDDTIGGDTNGDGATTTPNWDNWRGIEFRDGSEDANCLIDHAEIRYGGYSYNGNISLTGASPTIQNTTLSDGYMAIRADLESLPGLENNTYEDNFFNALSYDGGTIDIDTTWSITDTSYYIVDDVVVGTGVTLTIEPGAVVKFDLARKLFVDGALRVLGSSPAPVYFTSIRDDAVVGDTNGDGAATTPHWDNWKGIEFRDGSDDANSLVDHAEIRYGGYGYSGNIGLTGASPTVQNTTLSDGYMAIRANLESLPTLENNTYEGNFYNGLGYNGGSVDIDATWSITDTSYIIIDDVVVGTGNTLTIEPGAIVKFEIGKKLFVDGALRVLGSSPDTVYFTSIRDDAVGGDTNGDGAATNPDWDNWRGIEFRDSSDDGNSLVDHAVIRYGGYGNSGNINLTSASPTIQNSTLTESYYGIYTSGSEPNLICNNLYDNLGYGLYNATTDLLVMAENQWWGSVSGPFHQDTNPGGTGNAVSDWVDYDPWNTSPCGG